MQNNPDSRMSITKIVWVPQVVVQRTSPHEWGRYVWLRDETPQLNY